MDWIKLVIENLLKIPDVDELFGVGRHHQRELPAEVVNRLANKTFPYLLQLWSRSVHPHLPKLDEAVPAARRQKVLAILREGVDIFDTLLVLPQVYRLVTWVVWVPHLDPTIRMRNENRVRLLRILVVIFLQSKPETLCLVRNFIHKANTQNWPLSLREGPWVYSGWLHVCVVEVGMLVLVGHDFEYLQLAVPAACRANISPLLTA